MVRVRVRVSVRVRLSVSVRARVRVARAPGGDRLQRVPSSTQRHPHLGTLGCTLAAIILNDTPVQVQDNLVLLGSPLPDHAR
eukprot:scaffold75086_cov48-Phaeocystis_antarctica.AAC.3